MTHISYVNIFSSDIKSLSKFYKDIFGFAEVEDIQSPIFMALDAGSICIGFNDYAAYDLLNIDIPTRHDGSTFLLNFEVESDEQVDILTFIASNKRAKILKKPYITYYNWYQSVMQDIEGNVFRINHMRQVKAE